MSSLLDVSAVVRVLSGGVLLGKGCVGDPVVGDSIVHWFYFLSLFSDTLMFSDDASLFISNININEFMNTFNVVISHSAKVLNGFRQLAYPKCE